MLFRWGLRWGPVLLCQGNRRSSVDARSEAQRRIDVADGREPTAATSIPQVIFIPRPLSPGFFDHMRLALFSQDGRAIMSAQIAGFADLTRIGGCGPLQVVLTETDSVQGGKYHAQGGCGRGN